MQPGAHTPEELETLLEDACIVRDTEALLRLFEHGAVLVAGGSTQEARGREEIARAAGAMWARDRLYLAAPRRVVQARDTALSLGSGINVMRRGADGAWRYAICTIPADERDER